MANGTLRENLTTQLYQLHEIGFEFAGKVGNELVVQNSFLGFSVRDYETTFRVTHTSSQQFYRDKFSLAVAAYQALPCEIKSVTDYNNFISTYMLNP